MVPLHGRSHAIINQPLNQVRADDVLPELRLLQKLKMFQRRSRVHEVLQVWRLGPILEVGEVGDEFGLAEELLSGKVVQVGWVRK